MTYEKGLREADVWTPFLGMGRTIERRHADVAGPGCGSDNGAHRAVQLAAARQ